MDNQTDQFFPVTGTPEVRVIDIEVDLRDFGLPFVAKLKKRSNFSEMLGDMEEKYDKIARTASQMWKVPINEMTVRWAGQLARAWSYPTMPNGQMPNRDEILKLSVTNAEAFGELIRAFNAPEYQETIEGLEEIAKGDFTEGEPGTSAQ